MRINCFVKFYSTPTGAEKETCSSGTCVSVFCVEKYTIVKMMKEKARARREHQKATKK